MDFINLNRRFRAIDAEKPFELTDWEAFGFDRGLDWPALLKRPRVIVLAEASAGKTAEFKGQRDLLRARGDAAFYLTVETLASSGLDRSLSRDDALLFAEWRRSAETGWFFLDSVDEARINKKDIETAFNAFARDLGLAYDRARVLISCRGSVWTGEEDLALVRRTLRPETPRQPPAPVDRDAALFASSRTATTDTKVEEKPQEALPEFTVVGLTKLTAAQRLSYLNAAKIEDAESFEAALVAHNLVQFAERPGDLGTLVRYWAKARRFDGLAQMTELGITERLTELSKTRRDLSSLSPEAIRAGAERIAAAMTLSRTMNLVLAERRADGAEGLDPYRLLSDWRESEVDALLQRGLFVPSTYGLVRFFHRSAQEYLAACWFRRLGDGLTDSELRRLFFNEPFGIRTVPPSLRAVAGWLALWKPTLRRELLEREPLILIQHGDPRELSLAEKEQLLAVYAVRQAAGDLAYARLDHHALWLFAQPELGAAINAAVAVNPRHDFRFEMLRLVEQGGIRDCLELARAGSLEPVTRPYHRIVATRVLLAFDDRVGLKRVAEDLLKAPETFGPELAPSLTVALFPVALSVDDVLTVIRESRPGREFHNDGFSDELAILINACRSTAERRRLVAGVAALAFEPPLEDWPYVSKRHRQLVKHLGGLARAAILDADTHPYGEELETLLMAIERGGDSDRRRDGDDLYQLVTARPSLKQRLFWADVRRTIDTDKEGREVLHLRQIWPAERVFWSIEAGDQAWLEAALTRAPDERRIALSALVELARLNANPEAALERLAALVDRDDDLRVALADERRPRVETEDDRRWRESNETRQRVNAANEEDRRRWLTKLRDRLQGDQSTLSDPDHLRTKFGFRDLLKLSDWMAALPDRKRSGRDRWQSLEDAFGPDVAAAYRRGMTTLWRVTAPERPRVRKERRTVKYAVILSMGGIEIDAQEPGWSGSLSPALAERAAGHACLDDQGIFDWLGDLLRDHAVTAPLVLEELRREWRGTSPHHPFLERAAHSLPLTEPLAGGLLELIAGTRRIRPDLLDISRRILHRLAITPQTRARLIRRYDVHLAAARRDDDWNAIVGTIATLFMLDPEHAARAMFEVIEVEQARGVSSRAWGLLAAMFGRHRGLAAGFDGLSIETLRRIVATAYQERGRPVATDDDDDDDASSSSRDRFDEAGGTALTALLERDGPDAYRAMVDLAHDPVVGESAHRLMELAYEMAERQAERSAWSADEVRDFETRLLAPVASGSDLYSLALETLDDIQRSFDHDDLSDRAVVRTATLEHEVQDWLGAAIISRSGGRVHAVKEAQVVAVKRPDLLLAAVGSADQLAIEVKHAERGWTYKTLRKALEVQLVRQYLRPRYRRHGVLVITNHRAGRYWMKDGRRISFAQVIEDLRGLAGAIATNETGPVWVDVRGIDASEIGS